ncbi:conserved hypothetical protein [Pseudomonas sp. 8Z]|uniref:hypothetical protein n=1 Tax=Pseudomonas sp. 8Z TaxID=2653166 RepID=UPI0012F079B6|nr:hypothetical protein [Pseudomonas sp. 8Z]VXC74599.1 conserved hypothetical protein [Pseudomonas sp. 8Z]
MFGRAAVVALGRLHEVRLMDGMALFLGLLLGSIGLGFVIYGRRQSKVVPFLCGLGLMGFPYLVDSTLWLVLIGTVLLCIPYFVRT